MIKSLSESTENWLGSDRLGLQAKKFKNCVTWEVYRYGHSQNSGHCLELGKTGRAEAKLACILYSRFQVAVISDLGRVIDKLELTPAAKLNAVTFSNLERAVPREAVPVSDS